MRRIALACHGWRGLIGRSGLVVLLATVFATGAASVGVAADVDSGQGNASQDQGSAPVGQPAAPPADPGSSETTPAPQPPSEPPKPEPQPEQPKPEQPQPDQPDESGPAQSQPNTPATGDPAPAPPQPEPIPEGPAAAAEPAPVAAPPAAEPAPPALAYITDPLARLKAHHSESSGPVATKSQFPECEKVADPAACNQRFGELIDREQAECSGEAQIGIGTTPACRQAYRDFHTFQTCVDEPNYDACAAELAANPCFQDATSGACDRFLDVDRIEKCKNDFASHSFECQVLDAARELFCTIGGGLRTEGNNPRPRCSAGGGSEEQNSPGSRALPGSNQLATAGLVDPGARGDVGLKEVSSTSSTKSKKSNKTTTLPRTGLDLWPPILIGLLLVATGLLVRRRSSAARR